MLGIIAAVSTVVANISGAVAVSSIPVVGNIVALGAESIGTAVGAAVTGAGGSTAVGTIAAKSAQTAVNGVAIGIANSD